MTGNPGRTAALDQILAEVDHSLSTLRAAYRITAQAQGHEQATASIALFIATDPRFLDKATVAGLLAMALYRLEEPRE